MRVSSKRRKSAKEKSRSMEMPCCGAKDTKAYLKQ
jgi:hypothetical protein